MTEWFNLMAKNQGRRLYVGIFLAFASALSGVALLMLSGWFITATALTGIAITAGVVVMFDMYMPGSGIRFFTLSRTLGRYIERIYNHDSILRLIAVFRTTLFSGLTSLPSQQLRATSDSEWLSRLTTDLDALDSILLRYTIPPIVAGLLIVALSIFASFIWFELALYLGGFMLLCLMAAIWVTIGQTKHFASSAANLLNQCRADVIEHLQGAVELQAYQLMTHHQAILTNRLGGFYQVQTHLNNKLANIQLALDLVLGIALVALIYIAFGALGEGVIDGPIAVMLVMMLLGATEILQSMPMQFSTWGKTVFSANRLTTLMNTDRAIHGQTSGETKKLGLIDKVELRVSQNKKVASSLSHPLSFSISAKQTINIQGRSGTGKSTLANLLMAVDPTDSNNQIIVNNKVSLNDIAAHYWHQQLACLEQSNTLLAGSLGYNLALGLELVEQANTSVNCGFESHAAKTYTAPNPVTEADIWAALKLVELDQWASALPDGLNTWLGETGGKVSGGQARRICLARLLLRNPQLIILDEPFNGLDQQMAARIWANIQPWLSNKMLVLLTHETPYYLTEKAKVLDLNV